MASCAFGAFKRPVVHTIAASSPSSFAASTRRSAGTPVSASTCCGVNFSMPLGTLARPAETAAASRPAATMLSVPGL